MVQQGRGIPSCQGHDLFLDFDWKLLGQHPLRRAGASTRRTFWDLWPMGKELEGVQSAGRGRASGEDLPRGRAF
jgi:hypothetical protein